MRKLSIIILGLAVGAFVGANAYAGCGSCPGDAAKKVVGCSKEDCAQGACAGCATKAKKSGCSDECLKGLKLTTDQQAAVKELVAKCDKIDCDETSKKKIHAGLKKILTADQLATLKKQCEKKGCKEAVPVASLTSLQYACGGGCGDKDKGDDDKASLTSLQVACGGGCGDKDKGDDDKASLTSLQFACGGGCGDKDKGDDDKASLTSLQVACGGGCGDKDKGDDDKASLTSLQFAGGGSGCGGGGCGDKDKDDDNSVV